MAAQPTTLFFLKPNVFKVVTPYARPTNAAVVSPVKVTKQADCDLFGHIPNTVNQVAQFAMTGS